MMTMRQYKATDIKRQLKDLEIQQKDNSPMDSYKHIVAKTISGARTKLGLSICQLAKDAGIQYSTVFRIEHEQVVPDLATVCKLCKVLQIGFTIDYSWYSDSLEVVF